MLAFDEIERAIADAPTAQGYLAVATDRGERVYLLGPRTALDARVPMLDWRTAPIAEAFFRYSHGERYEIEGRDRHAEGQVLGRWLIVGRGQLDAQVGDDRIATRDGEQLRPRPSPLPAAPTDRTRLVVLDPEQQDAVDLAADTSLVIDGEAGVGKTLVALYRVASLIARARERGRRFRGLVLVPTEGLRRLPIQPCGPARARVRSPRPRRSAGISMR